MRCSKIVKSVYGALTNARAAVASRGNSPCTTRESGSEIVFPATFGWQSTTVLGKAADNFRKKAIQVGEAIGKGTQVKSAFFWYLQAYHPQEVILGPALTREAGSPGSLGAGDRAKKSKGIP